MTVRRKNFKRFNQYAHLEWTCSSTHSSYSRKMSQQCEYFYILFSQLCSWRSESHKSQTTMSLGYLSGLAEKKNVPAVIQDLNQILRFTVMNINIIWRANIEVLLLGLHISNNISITQTIYLILLGNKLIFRTESQIFCKSFSYG